MITRTTSRIVTFSRPFQLAGMDQAQPAGSYSVETDEEQLPTNLTGYRRLETRIRVPLGSGTTSSQSIPIDPLDLEVALGRDAREPGDADASETGSESSSSVRARACEALRQSHRTAAQAGMRRRGSP